MKTYKATFKIAIMTPEALLYQNEVQSAFFVGDTGEYELLPYHYPLLGILRQGSIILDWKEAVPVKFGLVRFFANNCIVLVEETERFQPVVVKHEEDIIVDSDIGG